MAVTISRDLSTEEKEDLVLEILGRYQDIKRTDPYLDVMGKPMSAEEWDLHCDPTLLQLLDFCKAYYKEKNTGFHLKLGRCNLEDILRGLEKKDKIFSYSYWASSKPVVSGEGQVRITRYSLAVNSN